MEKGSLNRQQLRFLLAAAKQSALPHLKSNDPKVRKIADLLFDLHVHYTRLLEGIGEGSPGCPVDIATDLRGFENKLAAVLSEIVPPERNAGSIKIQAVPAKAMAKMQELNKTAQQLLKRVVAAPEVTGRLPLRRLPKRRPR